MTAVVADDDPEIRAILAEYLARRGFEATDLVAVVSRLLRG
jgi:hypothetical protein